MRITGYRSLSTVNDWGRPIGDVNGVIDPGVTDVPVLVLDTDAGIDGIGVGPHDAIGQLFAVIDGEDPRGVGWLYDRMLAALFKTGHAGAAFGTVGAIDMALWDIKAKAAGEPLWRLLGGHDRFVPGYASALGFGLDDAGLASLYAQFGARGFTGAKVKGGLDAERDIARLRLVHDVLADATGERPWLAFDVNESWNRAQAVRFLARVEGVHDLAWIEEPLRRWDAAGHAALRATVRAAIATGENLTGLEQFRPLFEARAVDIAQPGSVWGITHFLRVALAAHAHDLLVSPVGYNANPLAAAAGAVPNHLAIEVQDLTPPAGIVVDHELADGGLVLGDRPGLGIAVDEAALRDRRADGSAVHPGRLLRPARAGRRITIGGAPRP